MTLTSRRRFVRNASLGALAWGLAGRARAKAPSYRLVLGQWSFHRALRAGQMDPLDFALRARREFGFDGVDYVNQFFQDKASDRVYLGEMRRRAEDAGVLSVLILIDAEGAVGDPDPAKRKQAIGRHQRWLDAAKALGGRGIRLNALSEGPPAEQARLVAEGARALAEYAAERDLDVLIENHGGLSSDGAWLASVVKAVGHPRCGTLPDFGNWDQGGGRMYDRYQGVRELIPLAKAVSVKAHDFDARGEETATDFHRMLRIVIDGGYRGEFLELEYEGDRLSEPDGTRATKALVEKVLAEIAAAPSG